MCLCCVVLWCIVLYCNVLVVVVFVGVTERNILRKTFVCLFVFLFGFLLGNAGRNKIQSFLFNFFSSDVL